MCLKSSVGKIFFSNHFLIKMKTVQFIYFVLNFEAIKKCIAIIFLDKQNL